jgi:hypothetical protein
MGYFQCHNYRRWELKRPLSCASSQLIMRYSHLVYCICPESPGKTTTANLALFNHRPAICKLSVCHELAACSRESSTTSTDINVSSSSLRLEQDRSVNINGRGSGDSGAHINVHNLNLSRLANTITELVNETHSYARCHCASRPSPKNKLWSL